MEGIQVKAFSLIMVLLFAVTTADTSYCVGNYQELEKIFTKSDENYGNLSEAFFVTNRINSRYVIVNYRILQCDNNQWPSNSNFTECFIVGVEQWIWSEFIVHILFHPYAQNYLSLWYDDTDERMATVSLTLPVLCQNQKNKLLSRLTQLLKKYAESQGQLTFDDNDNLGRSYKTDEIYDKFNKARILCICVSYTTSIVILLISLQIVSKPKKKLGKALANTKHGNILYSFSLVWLINIIWIIYLDHTVLIGHSPSDIPEDVYSQRFIYFIVIADFITIAFVLIITPFLCKETFFQRCCKLGNNYAIASKEYLVISTFMIFAVIHANHLVFILFGFLVEPIHGIANLIEYITTATYFISIFNIIFHYHRKHKDSRRSQFLHYTKLGFKLMFFYLYFLILYFVFSYVLYEDLMVTEYHGFIKSISISILLWLVIISIQFSYQWSGTVGYSTTTTTTTNTTTATVTSKNNANARKLTSRNREMEQNTTAGNHELRETTKSVVDFTPQKSDYKPLIDTSTENSAV